MDVLRLTLQGELTGDELEHIAQKVLRFPVGQGLSPLGLFCPAGDLSPHPSATCKLGGTSSAAHPADLHSMHCFVGGETGSH